MKIPVRISSRRSKRPRNFRQRHCNLTYVNVVGRNPSKPNSQALPRFGLINARSLLPKIDELTVLLDSNPLDLVAITVRILATQRH